MKLKVIFMKPSLYIILFLTMTSCQDKPFPHEGIDKLIQLDSMVLHYPNLTSFTTLKRSQKHINEIKVCDSTKSECKPEEVHYSVVLKEIGLPINSFDSIITKLDKIQFISFQRHEDYSVWIEDGAFGDVFGYLINHNPNNKNISSFTLNQRYHIGIGKEVRKNVYYFSSLID